MSKSMEQAKLEAEICGLRELIEEKFNRNSEAHEMILEQTTKTNGSVRELQKWRSFINGAISIMTVLVLPILFYVVEPWFRK